LRLQQGFHLGREIEIDRRDRAKARGVKMGRPPKLTAHQKKEAIKRRDHGKKEAIKRRDHGEETLAEIGRSYSVSGWTIARLEA
jgi:hypothetical protein